MLVDVECGGGGDDLFAISRQMGYMDGGGGSGSSVSAAAAQQQQFYYSCQPGKPRAMHAGPALHSVDACFGPLSVYLSMNDSIDHMHVR
jgi:hypothetical protein